MKSIYIVGRYLNKILSDSVYIDPWRVKEEYKKEVKYFICSLYNHYKRALSKPRVKKKIEKFLETKIY